MYHTYHIKLIIQENNGNTITLQRITLYRNTIVTILEWKLWECELCPNILLYCPPPSSSDDADAR